MARRKIFQLIFLMQRPTTETAHIPISKYVDVKGGLISERFLLWNLFLEILTKVKNFLRLGHFQTVCFCQVPSCLSRLKDLRVLSGNNSITAKDCSKQKTKQKKSYWFTTCTQLMFLQKSPLKSIHYSAAASIEIKVTDTLRGGGKSIILVPRQNGQWYGQRDPTTSLEDKTIGKKRTLLFSRMALN